MTPAYEPSSWEITETRAHGSCSCLFEKPSVQLLRRATIGAMCAFLGAFEAASSDESTGNRNLQELRGRIKGEAAMSRCWAALIGALCCPVSLEGTKKQQRFFPVGHDLVYTLGILLGISRRTRQHCGFRKTFKSAPDSFVLFRIWKTVTPGLQCSVRSVKESQEYQTLHDEPQTGKAVKATRDSRGENNISRRKYIQNQQNGIIIPL